MEFSSRAIVPDVCDIDFELDSLDTFQDIEIKVDELETGDPLVDFSMEHGLHMFEFDSMKDLILDTEAVVKTGEKRTILDELDTKDKIRRDCMWSTGQNLTKFFKADAKSSKPYTSVLHEEMSLTPPTSYINQYLKHFETPLPSDEESSCSSGDEMDAVSDWSSVIIEQESRLGQPPSTSDASSRKDHCYSSQRSPDSLTPPDSSEDEESYQGCYVSKRSQLLGRLEATRLDEAVKSILPTEPRSTSNVKFTFKVNIRTKSKKKLTAHRLKHGRQFLSPLVSGAGTGAAQAGIEKPKDARDLHNHMERKRRTELKNAFDQVKNCVPTISSADRVSKQMILDKAIEFCKSMRHKEAVVNKHRRALLERNNFLRKKMKALQSQAN